MSKSAQESERQHAIDQLHLLLKPGDTVHTILRHVSRSGMMRHISLVIVGPDGVQDITYYAARAMGDKIDPKTRGIRIGGCGSDMGFELVYGLGCAIWPKGTIDPHGTRNDEPGSDGGYALKHRWL